MPRDPLPAVKRGRPPSTAWLMSLSDCMLLLLTFFIMLFAMSSVRNDERWRDLSVSLANALRPITALDPRGLPRPSSTPGTIAGKRDIDYMAALLADLVAGEPSLAGYALELQSQGLVVRPPAALWQLGGPAPALSERGRAGIALLVAKLRLVTNEVVIQARVGAEARAWDAALARGWALAEALRRAGLGRDAPVFGVASGEPAGTATLDSGVAVVLRPARAGSG